MCKNPSFHWFRAVLLCVLLTTQSQAISPEEEKARFTVAPGSEIELVLAEDIPAGIGKFVAVDWDQHGNLWTMTALEYPVDANENPGAAMELYASKAKDKVLVLYRDPNGPVGYSKKPRVFADGLAIPLGILPSKNGVYVQNGPDILFLSDTDGDGNADKRDIVLTGFGVQDSHLFPHQFTRAPGNWIWLAQGAFNYGKVKTTRGSEVQFDQTRMARFRPDGSDFEITSQGPCNIWGLFMTMEGETWIQEANDFGYPAMLFHEYANYPGCSQAQWKTYAPEFPATAPHFALGGTGLSGLAVSDKSGWPEPFCDVIYIANPITRKIQAIKAQREGPRYALTKLPDFVESSDEMFRPVALRLGPDGCLYVVDWYNKIISHNEVPRNHPERDKRHGRIWRVKHSKQKLIDVPDFLTLTGDELLARLGGENTTQSHLAWQTIIDRQMAEFAPKLTTIIADRSQEAGRRIAALWALEGLGKVTASLLESLRAEPNRNLRRESVRVFGTMIERGAAGRDWDVSQLSQLTEDPDPDVRAELARTLGRFIPREINDAGAARPAGVLRSIELLALLGRAPIAGPVAKSTHNGTTIKTAEAYDREFERYLVRFFFEQHPNAVAAFLETDRAKSLPVENRLIAALALEPKTSSAYVAQLLPLLDRAPGQEELLRLAQFPDDTNVAGALKNILQQPENNTALELLLKIRAKLDAARLAPLLTDVARGLVANREEAAKDLGTRLASSFQLSALEPDLVSLIETEWRDDSNRPASSQSSIAALNALRELKSGRVDLFAKLAARSESRVQDAAISALAASRDPKGPEQVANLYSNLASPQRRAALAHLSNTKTGAKVLVASLRGGVIPKDELDSVTLDKLQTVLGADSDLAAFLHEAALFFRPVLRLNGSNDAWVDSDITLDGPFTVETWVKLDPGIDNSDGILGAPGVLDMNFFDGQFRVWDGVSDVIIGNKKMSPDAWIHLAVTRDELGNLRMYRNGELDTAQGRAMPKKLEHLRIGWTAAARGTAGWLSDYRIWTYARTDEEIRSDFDRSYEYEAKPARLGHYFFGGGPWGKLRGGAKVIKTSDFPPLLSPAEARTAAEKFSKFKSLAAGTGNTSRGAVTFKNLCMTCHAVGGEGGQIGPVLNGAGANGIDALLRNILTPNAAIEAGYRVYRVEVNDGDLIEGFRVSEDDQAIVLRRPNVPDARIAQKEVRRAAFTKSSMMPEGLIDPLPAQDVSDLFAYLNTLK